MSNVSSEERIYQEGVRDGMDRGDYRHMQAGKFEVSQKARVLVEAALNAVNEGKYPDVTILFDAALDFFAENIPDETGSKRKENWTCRECKGPIYSGDYFYICQPWHVRSIGPFCDSNCMRKFSQKMEADAVKKSVAGCDK